MNFEAKNSLVPILQVTELTHRFGKRMVLNGLNFEVQRGEVFGLLGPNGSGKSTVLALIAGLLNRQGGTISLMGEELPDAIPSFRQQIGMVFQSPSLDLKLSARENLSLTCSLYGIPGNERRERIDQQLDFAGLRERGKERVGKLSGGMRRRLEIARALIHEPSILLLDEPTVGLDEASFRDTWHRLEIFRKSRDITIIISTHRSEEGERCSRVAILDRGRTSAVESPAMLMKTLSKDIIEIKGADLQRIYEDVVKKFSLPATVGEKVLLIECENGHELIPRLVSSFSPGELSSLNLRKSSLSDVFLKITGHKLERDLIPMNGNLQ